MDVKFNSIAFKISKDILMSSQLYVQNSTLLSNIPHILIHSVVTSEIQQIKVKTCLTHSWIQSIVAECCGLK